MNLYDKYSALIMYHNDTDGRGAGIICYKKLLELKLIFCEENIELREMGYDDKVPLN